MVNSLKKIGFVLIGIIVSLLFTLPYIIFREQLSNYQALGYISVIVSCLISNVSVFLPSSSTMIVVVSASVLNPLMCIICGSIGTIIGEQSSYVCGRVGSMGINENSLKEKKIFEWIRKNGIFIVFLFAFIPLPVFDIVGVSAGIVKMNWLKYAIAVAIGKTLKFTLAVIGVYYFLPYIVEVIPSPFDIFISEFIENMYVV